MSFVFMVLHYPAPEHRDALAAGMRQMRALMEGRRGCTGVEPPYLTNDGACLVGISKWESETAFRTAGIPLHDPDTIVDGEIAPRQRFLVNSAD